MLVKERVVAITKVRIGHDADEVNKLNDVSNLIACYLDILDDNKMDAFVSPFTGEMIDRNDLLRVRGVIHGMIDCRNWELE